ncbi:MAG: aminoacyl-tRNA hydrolase [Oscillospiraceae bacterium]|nr:aminoacyl-tRNA hydrolase [Oscillospiraceae bacterium]
MRLIVGLGNPGTKYQHTRHNVGFDVVEVIAQKTGVSLNRKKNLAELGEGFYLGRRIALARPQTYMNFSGESVHALAQWYKLAPEELLVVYDDIDLPLGKLRLRAGGSAGTHNGMRSILDVYGRQDFPRLRVGVGACPEGWDLADWVLSHYADAQERQTQFDAFLRAAEAALAWAVAGMEAGLRVCQAGV